MRPPVPIFACFTDKVWPCFKAVFRVNSADSNTADGAVRNEFGCCDNYRHPAGKI